MAIDQQVDESIGHCLVMRSQAMPIYSCMVRPTFDEHEAPRLVEVTMQYIGQAPILGPRWQDTGAQNPLYLLLFAVPCQ
ncbi:hypothetical protein RN02_12595 [Pseudomonas sp. PI1]|nr:hypothetical protein RN02_12595 [Pseudomonas sp. PI1]